MINDDFLKDLENELLSSAKDTLKNETYAVECPHCKKQVHIRPNKSKCPKCKKTINLKLHFDW